MNDVHKGDTVLVSFKAEYAGQKDDTTAVRVTVLKDGHPALITLADGATVEVLERADDPFKNPEGAIRRENHDGGFSLWQSTLTAQLRSRWLCTYSTAYGNRGEYLDHEDVVGMPVVGAAPGTPAAEVTVTGEDIDRWAEEDAEVPVGGEVERALRLRDPQPASVREPRVFRSDGPEPPDGVDKLEAERAIVGWTHIERDGDYWRWSNESGRAFGAQGWPANSMGIQFREVLPS